MLSSVAMITPCARRCATSLFFFRKSLIIRLLLIFPRWCYGPLCAGAPAFATEKVQHCGAQPSRTVTERAKASAPPARRQPRARAGRAGAPTPATGRHNTDFLAEDPLDARSHEQRFLRILPSAGAVDCGLLAQFTVGPRLARSRWLVPGDPKLRVVTARVAERRILRDLCPTKSRKHAIVFADIALSALADD
jgi:hypothetical protein